MKIVRYDTSEPLNLATTDVPTWRRHYWMAKLEAAEIALTLEELRRDYVKLRGATDATHSRQQAKIHRQSEQIKRLQALVTETKAELKKRTEENRADPSDQLEPDRGSEGLGGVGTPRRKLLAAGEGAGEQRSAVLGNPYTV